MRVERFMFPMIRAVLDRPRLADVVFRFDRWGNPFGPEAVADPMTLAPAMRRDGPVAWRALYQQWFVMGYEEAREVLASPHTGTAHQAEVLLDVPPYTKLSPRSRSLLENFMLLTDPPTHTRLRGLVNRAFTPRQIARLDDRMGTLADELISGFDGDEIELMTDFAVPFPAMVIAELFGLPPDEWPYLRQVSQAVTEMLDPFRAFDPAALDAEVDALHDRLLDLAAERRADPREDLLTGLVTAQADDGDRLSEAELVAMATLILVAGHETTAGQIANSILALHDHPAQRTLVESDPELWPNAVEELLRFETAVRSDPRTALEEFELAGQRIKAGQNIVVLAQLANRDLRRFADADELRLDRDDPAPLSFGHGIHYCLGASLARAELRTALPRLLDALGDYSIDRSRIEWRSSITLRAPVELPIRRG